MSDPVILGLIGATLALLTLLVQTGSAIILKRMDRKQEVAAVEVAQVKVALANTTQSTTAALGEIHTLVNGQRGTILRSGALSARALYRAEPTEENRALMEKADEDLAKHEEAEAAIRAEQPGGRVYTHNRYVVE